MLLIYYTQYSIEFHCYKPLMLVGFNTVSGHAGVRVGRLAKTDCHWISPPCKSVNERKFAEGQEVR